MAGWIKLHRTILSHWIWSNPDYVKAWITILLTVNHEEIKVLIHGELIVCGRGQSILSLQSWAKLFGRKWTVQKIRTFFDLLKVDKMICTEGLRKTTRLTVCNYDSYQDEQQTKNTQRTHKEQTDNTQITTNKNVKNDKNEKKEKEALIFCFDSEQFKKAWSEWIEYKRAEYNFKYKSVSTEQKTMDSLIELSGNNEQIAIKIINQSIAKNWKGFFKLDPKLMPDKSEYKPIVIYR